MAGGTIRQHSNELSTIHPDRVDRLLDEGWALPAAFYADPAVHELENRLIFRRTWQVVCAEIELREPGDYVTTDIASVPIVLVRDDGEIRAFANICRHRGNMIMKGRGNCGRIRCGYHGWTYGLDGTLRAAPHSAAGELPPFESLGLDPVPVDTFGGLVFVCLEPREPLLDQLGDVPELLEKAGYDFPFGDPDTDLVPVGGPTDVDTTLGANWKLVTENTCECYHCPAMHRETLASVCDVTRFRFQLSERGKFGMVARLPLREELEQEYSGFQKKPGSQDVLTLCTLWPNSQIISGYVGEYISRFDPTGPGAVRYRSRGYVRPGLPAAEQTRLIDLVIIRAAAEDSAVMETTQRGLESGYFESGPLMRGTQSSNEYGVWSFQRQVWEELRPAFQSPGRVGDGA